MAIHTPLASSSSLKTSVERKRHLCRRLCRSVDVIIQMSFALTNCCLTWHAANQNGTHTHTCTHIHTRATRRHAAHVSSWHCHQHHRQLATQPILQLSAANSSIKRQLPTYLAPPNYPPMPHPQRTVEAKKKKFSLVCPLSENRITNRIRMPHCNRNLNRNRSPSSAGIDLPSLVYPLTPPLRRHWAFHFIRKSFDDCHRRCD